MFLWADNTPYTAHNNLITKSLFAGMYVEGDYWGGKIVHGDDSFDKSGKNKEHSQNKFDFNHSIAYGLNNLHEGITICHPVNLHKDF